MCINWTTVYTCAFMGWYVFAYIHSTKKQNEDMEFLNFQNNY